MPEQSTPGATHQLRIEPAGLSVPVPPGRTLLQAALDAGVRLESSCRNGSCRACMARLLQGEVAYGIEWPGLLAEEKAEGWVLPCVALPLGDVTLRWPGDAFPVPESAGHPAVSPPP